MLTISYIININNLFQSFTSTQILHIRINFIYILSISIELIPKYMFTKNVMYTNQLIPYFNINLDI